MPTVTVSSVIDAPASEVWALIRDFNGLPNWHPRMVESHIEDDLAANEIGAVRNFQTATGANLREKLIGMSDDDYSVTYQILQTPAPITNHRATLRLFPVTDGDKCFAEWTATFDCPPEKAEAEAAGMGKNVFQGGFDALKKHFGG
ncbi:SRPBCC family protein [Jiella avicenniae]|uniref:SRPBCC family protein n=1 Tax=Jiella avicenniae TaxID=2907202 RepID=A0A9X1P262_9HYPH|nr:SRPBCC family protein [Jiella avicenniae]MCE7029672.1 SRPBCC family protein [Jiella avicenniae]